MSNVISGPFKKKERPKGWLEEMSYGELLAERRYHEAQLQVAREMLKLSIDLDPRSALSEAIEVDKLLKEFERGHKSIIFMCERELIRRTKKRECE